MAEPVSLPGISCFKVKIYLLSTEIVSVAFFKHVDIVEITGESVDI